MATAPAPQAAADGQKLGLHEMSVAELERLAKLALDHHLPFPSAIHQELWERDSSAEHKPKVTSSAVNTNDDYAEGLVALRGVESSWMNEIDLIKRYMLPVETAPNIQRLEQIGKEAKEALESLRRTHNKNIALQHDWQTLDDPRWRNEVSNHPTKIELKRLIKEFYAAYERRREELLSPQTSRSSVTTRKSKTKRKHTQNYKSTNRRKAHKTTKHSYSKRPR